MDWETCQGLASCQNLHASFARQLLGGGGGDAAEGAKCNCLPPKYLGTETEHVMVMACLWVAFAISVIILIYYMYHTYLGTCGWEEVYVVIIEMLKTILEVFFETSTPATIVQFNGVYISWLRYAEWLLTCPVILIHLSNLTGLGHYNKRTMRLIVSDIGTIIFGITAALCKPPAKIAFFIFGLCYGSSTFITAAGVYISAYKTVPKGECQTLVKLCAWVFFGSWLLFPLLFLMGPEGFGHLTPWGSIIAHTFADLLSKNLWGLLAHHLRNKINEHIHMYGSIDAVPPEEQEEEVAGGKLGKTSYPMSSHAVMAAAKGAAENGAIAMISANRASTLGGSPTKASATLLCRQSFGLMGGTGAWEPAAGATDPIRVLLGLPAEEAETVLQQFQDQFASLPFAAEALPATGATALLSAAANAAAFGGADAVLLHVSYLRPGAPGVASGAGLVGTLKEMGIKVCVYGCDAGGPPEDIADLATSLDGWVEGPTWAGPLNNRQLAALLLMMNATRTGSRPSSAQGRPVSPRGINMSLNGTGTLLRSRSTGNFGTSPVPGPLSSRPSFDAGSGLTPRGLAAGSVPLRAAASAMGASAAARGTVSGLVSASGAAGDAAGLNMSETELLQQLMGEISRLKKELGDGR